MDEKTETHGEGYLVEGDPDEAAEQERERLGEESTERERVRIRSGLGAGEGANDDPAAEEGVSRGDFAPR